MRKVLIWSDSILLGFLLRISVIDPGPTMTIFLCVVNERTIHHAPEHVCAFPSLWIVQPTKQHELVDRKLHATLSVANHGQDPIAYPGCARKMCLVAEAYERCERCPIH